MLPSLEYQLPEPVTQLNNPNKAHFKDSQPVVSHISFVNVAAYQRVCNKEGATAY